MVDRIASVTVLWAPALSRTRRPTFPRRRHTGPDGAGRTATGRLTDAMGLPLETENPAAPKSRGACWRTRGQPRLGLSAVNAFAYNWVMGDFTF